MRGMAMPDAARSFVLSTGLKSTHHVQATTI